MITLRNDGHKQCENCGLKDNSVVMILFIRENMTIGKALNLCPKCCKELAEKISGGFTQKGN